MTRKPQPEQDDADIPALAHMPADLPPEADDPALSDLPGLVEFMMDRATDRHIGADT